MSNRRRYRGWTFYHQYLIHRHLERDVFYSSCTNPKLPILRWRETTQSQGTCNTLRTDLRGMHCCARGDDAQDDLTVLFFPLYGLSSADETVHWDTKIRDKTRETSLTTTKTHCPGESRVHGHAVAPAEQGPRQGHICFLGKLAGIRTPQIALDVSRVSADLLAAGLLVSIHFCSLFLRNANICPCFALTGMVSKPLITH